MHTYTVTWTISIDATTPEEAAKLALDIQRDPFSTATVFDVTDERETITQVDLFDKTEHAAMLDWYATHSEPDAV